MIILIIEFCIFTQKYIKYFTQLFIRGSRKKSLGDSIYLNMMFLFEFLKTSYLIWGTTHNIQPVTA